MQYFIGFLVVIALVIGGFLLVTGMSDVLDIAATVADTENVVAQTGLTQEETDREIIDLLGELVEQNGEQAEYQRTVNERLLQVIEDLSRPDNSLLIALGVVAVVLSVFGIVALVALIVILVTRRRDELPLSLPAPIDREKLGEGQWRMMTGEYVEVPELIERRG